MAINTTTRQTTAFTSGNDFSFSFKVYEVGDVKVIQIQTSNGAETVLTITTNYTVTLNDDQDGNPGGTVTLVSSGSAQNLATGYNIVITSKVSPLQQTEITNQGGFFPEVINDVFDKAVILDQQQQSVLDKTIRFPLTQTVGGLEITENAANRANKILQFDGSGDLTILGTVDGRDVSADGSKLDTVESGATADQTIGEIKSLIAGSPLDASHLATDSVTGSELAANSVDSSELVDGSIDTQHIGNQQVDASKLAPDSVNSTKIQDNAINSEHYVDGSIDRIHLEADIIDSSKLADNSVNSEHYIDGSIDHVHLATDIVDGDNIADNSINSEHYVDGSIDHEHLANDIINADNIQDDVVNSEHIVAGAIDNEHYAAGSITSDKLDGATVVTASEQASAASNDTSFLTVAAADARFFNVSTGDTIKDGDTFPDNDTTIATTAAINDRIIDLIDDVGGFDIIQSEQHFPNTNPQGTTGQASVLSVQAASTDLVPSGTTVTINNGNLADNANITITGVPSTIPSGFGFLIESTSTLHTYTFHRLVPKATEVTTVAGKAVEIGRLGTADAVADMAILGTTDVVADMNMLAVSDVISDMNTLAVSDVIADMNTLAVSDVISDMDAVATNVTNVNNVGNNITNVNNLTNSVGANQTFTVTVQNVSGNKYFIDGVQTPVLKLARGKTYTFNLADSSNSTHPLAFRDSSDNAYTTGVTTSGTAGSSGATVVIVVAANAPNTLKYYCTSHGNSMGNTINVIDDNVGAVAADLTNIGNVAGALTNVNNVGGSIANVNTVASNLSSVNSFANTYRIGANNPTSSLDVGDLFFNTTSESLKVYTGSAWVDGVTQTGNFALKTGNTFTGSNVHNDNVKSIYGTSSDGLEIFHNGSDSIIDDVGTGTLKLQLGGATKLEIQSGGIGVTGNIVVSGNVDGRDLAADGTKLDGIESNAKDDQTASDIKTLLNSSGLVNAQIDASAAIAMSKLALSITNSEINASAAIAGSKIDPDFGSQTVDSGQVNITSSKPRLRLIDSGDNPDYSLFNNNGTFEIYDDNAPGARFTVDNSKIVSTLNHDFSSGIDVTGNITVTGTVDGRDVAADGTKLDGIESSATADQTASEILTLIKTVDGAGSGLDADLLDGVQQAEAATASTIVKRNSAGNIYANFLNTPASDVSSGVTKVMVETGNDNFIRHGSAAAVRAFLNVEDGATADQSNSEIKTAYEANSDTNAFTDALLSKLNGIAASATNVTNTNQLTNGAGFITSADGGNAATLDSIDSSQFLRSDAADSASGLLTLSAGLSFGNNARCPAALSSLSDGSTITVDFVSGIHHTVTLGGNRTFGNPSNTGDAIGQSGSIFIVQNGSGGNTASFHSDYKFAGGNAPVLSTSANAVDRLDYVIRATDNVHCVVTLDVK